MLASPLLFATSALAETLIEHDQLLDEGSLHDSYRVLGPATLTTQGATTFALTAEAGAALELNDTTVQGGNSGHGISLEAARANVRGSTITSNTRGISLFSGSHAVFSDSVVEGIANGALINASTVELLNTKVSGTGATAVGAQLFDGSLTARAGSEIRGTTHGVAIGDDGTLGGSTLELDNSLVEGIGGSAILVGQFPGLPTTATINVLNGSTLVAGNGVLMEVADSASANLRVNNSHLLGDIIVDAGGTANVLLENAATLKGRLHNVDSLGLASNAQWVMVEDSQLGDLTMNGGSVRFGEAGEFYQLQVDNLAGNGTFVMEADFSSGQTDFLDITGNATGSHGLLISSSGRDPLGEASLHMVHAASGDASFSLVGGPVDLGTYSYDLVQRGANDWYLDLTTRILSPGAQSVMALGDATPTVWYGEMGVLRSRMGEVRRNPQQSGLWLRSYGNKYNVSERAGAAYQQQQHGMSFGADTPLDAGDGHWLVGVTAGYSRSNLNLARGSSGSIDSYHAGAYATWLQPQSGYYLDATARLNRFQNKADVRQSDGTKAKGDYATLGVGVSLEAGRHLALSDGYFIEPFVQLSGLMVQGKDYRLDNGLQADVDRTRSLLGKLGATAGRTFDAGQGRTVQPYVRAAAVHEFVSDNQVRVNGNALGNDLSGTRGEIGAGVSVAWAQQWQAHADVEYSNGSKIEQPWGVNFGLRYNW
ncbi:autotransporter outer membrane beta-barrel domain-containing protein [Pseudomonas sp. NPDC089406]|uniref:autotransporter outer membrane beta-barrel domain-containing protein n=1 Tax=Pseudomonas sp. NPDC089406 TaxID=3364463 RepID=UPI00384C5038